MCGIAGLIHRGNTSNVGFELQGMLQALKHRGEDSTGYALYGDTDGKNFIMRFKVGENVGEGSSSVMELVWCLSLVLMDREGQHSRARSALRHSSSLDGCPWTRA